LDFHRLRVFYAVARRLSFSQAADDLYTSQPNVSRHIAKLEAELGTPLFHRTGTRVTLTDAGRMVYGYAQRVFELTEGLQRTLNELKGLERGYLRLGASSTPGLYLLPPRLADFRDRYPGLDITLHLGNSLEIVTLVLANELDLGFVGGYELTPGIQVQPFATDELVFIVAGSHPLARQSGLQPRDLAGETFIWREEGSGMREAMAGLLRALGIVPTRGLELRGCEGVKRAVAAGLGISVVSRHAIELELASNVLAVLQGPGLQTTRALSIVTHKGRHLSAAALAFLAHLRKG